MIICKKFTVGDKHYTLELYKGNSHGHTCFSLHIAELDSEDHPTIAFYKSRFDKDGPYRLKIPGKFTVTRSMKEGKLEIVKYLTNS